MPLAASPTTSWPPVWRTSMTMRRMNAASSTTRMRAMSLGGRPGGRRSETAPSGEQVDGRAGDLVLGGLDARVGVVGDARRDQAADLLGEVDALTGRRRDDGRHAAVGARRLPDALGVDAG